MSASPSMLKALALADARADRALDVYRKALSAEVAALELLRQRELESGPDIALRLEYHEAARETDKAAAAWRLACEAVLP